MSDNKRLPVPFDSRAAQVPAYGPPRSGLGATLTRWQLDANRRALEARAALIRAAEQNYTAQTALARAYLAAGKAAAEVADLPAILAEDHAVRAHARRISEDDRQREREIRDLDHNKTAADKRRHLHHASRQEAEARVHLAVMQRTSNMQIEQAINAFLTGDYATLDKLMRAKHGFEQAWGDGRSKTSAPNDLEQRLTVLEAMLAKAKAENASSEFRLKLHEEIDAIKDEIEAAHAEQNTP